jgi:hypothetical protein
MSLKWDWEFSAKRVEETLDRWLSERIMLYGVRYLLVALTCMGTGTVLQWVIGVLGYRGRRALAKEGRRRASSRTLGGKIHVRVDSGTHEILGMGAKSGRPRRMHASQDTEVVPDLGDLCVVL